MSLPLIGYQYISIIYIVGSGVGSFDVGDCVLMGQSGIN